jgi:hypothetical protein
MADAMQGMPRCYSPPGAGVAITAHRAGPAGCPAALKRSERQAEDIGAHGQVQPAGHLGYVWTPPKGGPCCVSWYKLEVDGAIQGLSR